MPYKHFQKKLANNMKNAILLLRDPDISIYLTKYLKICAQPFSFIFYLLFTIKYSTIKIFANKDRKPYNKCSILRRMCN